MQLFKSHIARLFCLLSIFLISSNIGYTAYHFTSDQYIRQQKEVKSTSDNHQSFHVQDEQILNLLKDQQEFDFDVVIDEVFHAVFHFYVQQFSTESAQFHYCEPILHPYPIWIKHLQIRL